MNRASDFLVQMNRASDLWFTAWMNRASDEPGVRLEVHCLKIP